MTVIETSATTPSNAIRTHSFPVLEAGNISFPEGVYSVGFDPGTDRQSFTLRHEIRGAGLISRLIGDGRACYVCAISSPRSSYRRTFTSRESEQVVRWNNDDLGEAPQFTPMIVSVGTGDLVLDRARDGVHQSWAGHRLRLLAGQKLAVGQVVYLKASVLQMLSIHADEDLPPGCFVVEGDTEHGFHFHVRVSPDLHEFLQVGGADQARQNIMTHVVSACFSLLQREYREDEEEGGWSTHRNLVALQETLHGQGLPHWTEENFSAEEVATRLYPHVWNEAPDEGGE